MQLGVSMIGLQLRRRSVVRGATAFQTELDNAMLRRILRPGTGPCTKDSSSIIACRRLENRTQPVMLLQK